MQKLSVKLKNTPRDTSLVPCSVKNSLNREETLSVNSKVLADNNSEGNQPGNRGNAFLLVFVLNKDGKPLMPCKPAKARRLLKQGRAKAVQRSPFTIQLLYGSSGYRQSITLGVDLGYEKTGFSAISDSKELISGEVNLRKNISKMLMEKRMYRRNRRNKLWYREPRFNNRVSSKKEGWLAPSIKHKLDSHIKLVEKIKKLLPISKVMVEVANFDIQKIKNPGISGKEYQQGEQLGFYNIREYVFHRDGHICQKCKGKSGDKILQSHHIRGKKEGATDRPEELMTVCKTCHEKHHKGINPISIKKIKDFKPETFMSTIRWKLVNRLGCQWTYGYITKHNRIQAGLEKSHKNDAFIIAGGNGETRTISFEVVQKRKNNRCLQMNRKGFKPSIRRQRHKHQPYDLVKFQNRIYMTKGVFNCGNWIYLIDGTKETIRTATKKLDNWHFSSKTLIWNHLFN